MDRGENSNPIDIHLSTFVDGEYTRTLVAATKGDVYSCGIVKCATDLQREFGGLDNLPVKQLYTTGCQRSLIGKDNNAELLQCMKFACSCVWGLPASESCWREISFQCSWWWIDDATSKCQSWRWAYCSKLVEPMWWVGACQIPNMIGVALTWNNQVD